MSRAHCRLDISVPGIDAREEMRWIRRIDRNFKQLLLA